MADFVFNVARGRIRYYYDQVRGNLVQSSGVAGPPNTLIYNGDATAQLLVVAIDANGTSDDALKDFDRLGSLLSGTPNEVTNTGYARKVYNDTDLANSSEDDSNNRLDLDIPDPTWIGVQAGSAWTDLLTCWKPTSSSADSDIIPLTCCDFPQTPAGFDITWAVGASGFFRSES